MFFVSGEAGIGKTSLVKKFCYDLKNSISAGNPFYVTEILASYSTGVPENIKDTILSVYNRQTDKIKDAWELLSVVPAGFNIKYISKWDPSYAVCIDRSLESKILTLGEDISCPYYQAFALFATDAQNKKQALGIMQELGAISVYEKMKMEMRSAGIKNIPRGAANHAQQYCIAHQPRTGYNRVATGRFTKQRNGWPPFYFCKDRRSPYLFHLF